MEQVWPRIPKMEYANHYQKLKSVPLSFLRLLNIHYLNHEFRISSIFFLHQAKLVYEDHLLLAFFLQLLFMLPISFIFLFSHVYSQDVPQQPLPFLHQKTTNLSFYQHNEVNEDLSNFYFQG